MQPSVFTFTTGSIYTTSQLVAFHNAAFADYFVDFTMTVERFETIMGAALGHMPYLSLYMHTTSGDFVGFARTGVRGRRAWCGGLALVPAWRGKKVGPLLTRKYLELLREQSSVKTLQLECINVNAGALKLYKSVGFMVNFALQDYVVDGIDSSSATLPEQYLLRSADQVDLRLPWLQYRTQYAWQRGMSTILAVDAVQLEIRDDDNGRSIVAVIIEKRADHARILAFAFEGPVEADLLDIAIRQAALACGKGEARILLEPEHSEAIVLLESIATRDETLEEQHMVYEFEQG